MARQNYFVALVSVTATIGLPTAVVAISMAACSPSSSTSPAASAAPHGAIVPDGQVLTWESPGTGRLLDCPEQDPAQPNCKVPR